MKNKILVIDDEPEILSMIAGHFGPRGFMVYTAPDGNEGIRLCRSVMPDVVLLDLKMKGMDGDRVCPEIRRIVPDAKIFLVTAYDDETLAGHIPGLGADACFEKPVPILELENAVRKALSG